MKPPEMVRLDMYPDIQAQYFVKGESATLLNYLAVVDYHDSTLYDMLEGPITTSQP